MSSVSAVGVAFSASVFCPMTFIMLVSYYIIIFPQFSAKLINTYTPLFPQTVMSLPAMSLAAQNAVKVVLSVDGYFAARDAQGVTEHIIRSVPGDIYDTLKIHQRKVFHLMLVSPSNVPRRQLLPGPSYLLVSDHKNKRILQGKLPAIPSPKDDKQPDTPNEEEIQASSSDKEPTPPTNQPPPGRAPRRRRKGPLFFLRFLPKYRRIGVTTEVCSDSTKSQNKLR